MDAPSIPPGLSQRAHRFLGWHGVRANVSTVPGWWDQQSGRGVPSDVIDRAWAFEAQWQGVVLPPSPLYEGGPSPLCVCGIEQDESDPDVWWIEAGVQRASCNFGFYLGPDSSFGVSGGVGTWVPLHASVEGWVESLALQHELQRTTNAVNRVTGRAVDEMDLTGMEEVPEIQGIVDTWWRGEDRWVAIYKGEARLYDRDDFAMSMVYSTGPA